MVLRREWDGGTVPFITARQRGDSARRFQKGLHVTRSLIDRLGLEKELHGHMGCVNCLEWNSDGSILASASDDHRVILWDPFRYKALQTLVTGHTGNIFSVKFLTPALIATCAADHTVRIRELVGGGDGGSVCSCHCGRVKRLATAPDSPHLLWSAGEDGLVLQHDVRVPHQCNSETRNVLVNLLNHLGRDGEAKCIAVNPRRPELLAVGANDFYVRMYDRRMIKLGKLHTAGDGQTRTTWERQNYRCARAGQGDPDNNIPRGCVQYFAPGHLSTDPNEHAFPKKVTTYVTFSADGTELLVNLGSEQVYLFDVNSARKPILLESYIIEHNHRNSSANGFSQEKAETSYKNGTRPASPHSPNGSVILDSSKDYNLPSDVRELKERANDAIHKEMYATAVELFNRAIARCSDCAVLFSNRAAALMRRNWAGDIYSAIRDCYTAIKLDGQHVKSHFRLAKGLMELQRAREAHECLLYFKDKFPRRANSHAVFLLQKDISVALGNLDTTADEEPEESYNISSLEKQLRTTAADYEHRFLGHCNTTTDIKEANFLGADGNFIAAGSDDGSIFIWCRRTGNIVRCLRGDDSIVNCIQVHPSTCLVATSGIEIVVRLWSPQPEDGRSESRLVTDARDAALANQQRMRADPFETMLLNITSQGGERARVPDQPVSCRAS